MNPDKNTSRLLGGAFLLQAIASLTGGLILFQPLTVPGDITGSMTNITNNAIQMRAGIIVEMITAAGIVFLGAMLYITLRKQNRKIALAAFGLYILEASLLASSRFFSFALLQISRESAAAGNPAYLLTLGSLFYETIDFGYSLHMLVFGAGATMFYYLFLKSDLIPLWLAVWGLIAAPLAFAGTLLVLLGYEIPLWVFLPNLPFELTIGVWLIIKGFRTVSKNSDVPESLLVSN